MADACSKHSFEPAAGVCRQCHNSYCEECLVYAFGPKKPPYCITCALNAAGVRRKGATTNPRLRKKGIFGRRELVDEEPRYEPSFSEVHIELPEEALNSPVMAQTTRREAPSELIAAVNAADTAREAGPNQFRIEDTVSHDEHAEVLADWAASLDGDALADSSPTTGVAAWPVHEGDSGTSF